MVGGGKIRLVEETLEPGMSVSFVARKHGLSPSLLLVVGAAGVRQLEERIRELERLLSRKTLEVEILKEGLAAARAKKPLLRWPSPDPAGSP